MVYNLAQSAAADQPAVGAVLDAFKASLTPESPPYDKWFAQGNQTLKMSWSIGPEQEEGFPKNLLENGFRLARKE